MRDQTLIRAVIDGDPTTVEAGATIDSFALRQSDSSNNETIYVDNLVVTSVVPEPSTLALGGFGLFALLLVRRRS